MQMGNLGRVKEAIDDQDNVDECYMYVDRRPEKSGWSLR